MTPCLLLILGLSLSPAPAAMAAPAAAAARLADEGRELYRRGQLGEALLKFEEAIKGGAEAGDLYYQTGYCLKTVRKDAAAARQYILKAIPLLEAQTSGSKSPAPFYYLGAIYMNEMGDRDKGMEVVKRGLAEVEKGTFKSADGESQFQIGRLYTLANRPEEAAAWYAKSVATFDKQKSSPKQYMIASLEQIAAQHAKKGESDKEATARMRLLTLEPEREKDRLSTGLLLVKLGRHKEAIEMLKGIMDDDLATEAGYIVRVLQRYMELGSPPPPAAWAKMDAAALDEELTKATTALGEARKKQEEHPRVKEGWVAPETPERVAADKLFFGLMVEYLRRGQPLREFAFTRGLAGFIFR